ncbi:MAG: hypothetical protein R2828_13860 [Saprospiraceae bacterium]
MKKIFIFALFILIATGFIIDELPSKSDRLKKYYLFVNKAEMAITKKDYLKAVSYYKKAFQGWESGGIYKDHHNALRASDAIGNEKFAYFNASILAQRGICPKYFDKFQVLKNNNEKYRVLTAIAGKEAENVSRTRYREEIEAMYQMDQQVRWDGMSADSIARTDSLNFIRFIALVNHYGFPSDDRIGLICTENNTGVSSKELRTLIRHFAQRKNQNLIALLMPAYKTLKYDHYQCASMFETLDSKANNYRTQPVINLGESFYIENFNDSMKTVINERRAELHLPTMEEQIEKTKAYLMGELKGYFLDVSYMVFDTTVFPKSYVDQAFVKLNIKKN